MKSNLAPIAAALALTACNLLVGIDDVELGSAATVGTSTGETTSSSSTSTASSGPSTSSGEGAATSSSTTGGDGGAGGSGTGGVGGTGAGGGGGSEGCTNGAQDGAETAVDCGGGECPPCVTGEACRTGSDCESLVCTDLVCADPSCDDGVANGDETDTDCGGGSPCLPCRLGRLCEAPQDCVSSRCDQGVCVPTPIGVWTQVISARPPGNIGQLYFDPISGSVRHVGSDGTNTQTTIHQFVPDGASSTWELVNNVPSPEGRIGLALAVDPSSGSALMFAGQSSDPQLLADLWQWEGSSWASVVPAGESPPVRAGAGFAYYPPTGEYLMYGGTLNINTAHEDEWIWTGSMWTTSGAPASPGPRRGHAMVYDSARQRIVTTGGNAGDFGPISEGTWLWDGATWQQVADATPGPARSRYAMAYDSDRERVVIASGAGQTLTDSWEWDGAEWLQTSNLGPADDGGTMAYDPGRKRMVYVTNAVAAATWEYHALATPCAADTDCGSGFCSDNLCCNSACSTACRECNGDTSAGTCVGVANADDPDSCTGSMTCDATGNCISK